MEIRNDLLLLRALVAVRVVVLGREVDLDLRVLPGAAGLLLVGVLHCGGLRDGLPVGHLGLAHIALHLELTLQGQTDRP